ncbi:hypothetical protein BC938DRAFT_477707, partial [Jimgerdemannia flammicorona]
MKQFEGWENSLDPENFNLLSILEFRKNKDDLSSNKMIEHHTISRFVSHIATTTTNKIWKKAASSLNGDGVLQRQAQWDEVKSFWRDVELAKTDEETLLMEKKIAQTT